MATRKTSLTGAAALLLLAPAARAEAPAPPGGGPSTTLVATPAPAPASAAAGEPEGAPKRGWKVNAGVQYRQLAVTDPDPRNDRAVLWSFGGSVEAFKGGRVAIRTGLLERFVAESEESGWKFRDTSIALSYGTPVALGPKTLNLDHKLALFLPTSRASLAQDLYCAPQYALNASLEAVKGLVFSVGPDVRYRWHKYAERAGFAGELNVQWEINVGGGVDYTFLDSETFGALTLGASAGSGWQRYYASREAYTSSLSDQDFWAQNYSWEAHLGYDPVKYLSLGASLEQGGPVLRDGVVNTFFVHRDETELVFTLSGNY